MLTLRRGEQLRARIYAVCGKYLATQTQTQATNAAANVVDEEYSAVPEYPEIRDPSFKGKKLQKAKDWHEEIRSVPTIEEKMIKINMPRYYGYKVIDLNDTLIPYNALPLMQHYTRTSIEELPLLLGSNESETHKQQLDAFVQAARADVIEALEYAHDYLRHKPNGELSAIEHERQLTQTILEQLNRTLLYTLSADCSHLNELEVDYNPRHEAFWAVGGVDPPKSIVKYKEGRDWSKEFAKDSEDRFVQYTGSPYLALRHRQQLPTWHTTTAAEQQQENVATQLPRFNFDARTLGYTTKYQHAVNVPGYWPHSSNGFGFLSFQSRAHLQARPASYGGAQDLQESLHVLAIQSSYAWLLAQANYQGFNTYNELTYPLNTQTIITNGREWSFYEYQLNTLLVFGENVNNNTRVNNCRGTPALALYEQITPEGKCVGFNDDVLRQLISFYAKAPTVQRSLEERQPYVESSTLNRIADYTNEDQREFLDRTFKHLTSKRPRHLELPETYLWEKLYKIDHKTRPMEARRRFFELSINPWRRTLDQHDKEYIPRKERPGGPKSRDRFKKTYYP